MFGTDTALIGVVHCPPFPGAPRYRGESVEAIYEGCVRDAVTCLEGGLSGLIVENHGDVPFSEPEDLTPETAACLAVATDRTRAATGARLGINVLANAPIVTLAAAAGAAFIRVNQCANAYVANEGFMEGRAAEAMRYRSFLRAESVRVFADTHVKHGAHAITADRTVAELTRDLAFFEADAVIATGHLTGDAASVEEIETARDAVHLPLLVGSGVTPQNVGAILARIDGVIVASSLERDGVWWNPVGRARVEAFRGAAWSKAEAPRPGPWADVEARTRTNASSPSGRTSVTVRVSRDASEPTADLRTPARRAAGRSGVFASLTGSAAGCVPRCPLVTES